jgi:hypothetical protein
MGYNQSDEKQAMSILNEMNNDDGENTSEIEIDGIKRLQDINSKRHSSGIGILI